MRRPWPVTTVLALESLAALGLVFTAIYIFVGSRTSGEMAVVEVIISWILGGGAVLTMLSCWGLWKSKAWGWWLALLMDVLGLIAFVWDSVERHVWPGVDEVSFILLFVILIALLLASPVRNFFLGRHLKRAEAGADS